MIVSWVGWFKVISIPSNGEDEGYAELGEEEVFLSCPGFEDVHHGVISLIEVDLLQ